MSSLLITGFTNFGKVENNPSEILVNLLKQKYQNNIDCYIFKGYKDIDDNLEHLLSKSPTTVIIFGLASKTPYVRLEKVAKIPSRLKTGEKQYRSNLPLREIYMKLVENNIRVAYSNSAGDYWCNYLFYKVSSAREHNQKYKQGFIHIPNLDAYNSINAKELNLLNFGSTIVDLFL